MKLLTKAIETKLMKNWENQASSSMDDVPVVKFFNPAGRGTWYISEYDKENGLFFGLCDLGMGYPEMGYVSKAELESIRLPFGLKIERDMYTTLRKTFAELKEELS